jgi:hypothetical protein
MIKVGGVWLHFALIVAVGTWELHFFKIAASNFCSIPSLAASSCSRRCVNVHWRMLAFPGTYIYSK